MIATFKYDKAQDAGWILLKDVPFDGKPFIPEIVEFRKTGESSVDIEEMNRRSKELNAYLGQSHAEYLLDHPELIPQEWQGKYYLMFPGTVWRFSDDVCCIPYLLWGRGKWHLDFCWLKSDWSGRARFIRALEISLERPVNSLEQGASA